MTYKIMTTKNLPKFDPYTPRWRKVLGWLRLVPRERFVLMSKKNHNVMWCHPDSVESLTRLLKQQGFAFEVRPALAAVPKAHS